MTTPTYCLSLWDHDAGREGDWAVEHVGLSKWQLRGAIRDARSRGYDDDVSILVERED